MIRNSDCDVTVSSAERVTPSYVAEMVAVPDPDELIATENAPVELDAGTVTVAGTVARDGLLLASATVAPPAGVSAENVSVAEVWVVPVCTVEGLSVRLSSTAPEEVGAAVTVSVALRITPAYVAETVAVVDAVTVAVVTV